MDLCFRGQATLNRGNSPEILAKARELFERALELDRVNVDALVGLGIVDASVGSSFMSDNPAPILAAAESILAKTLAAAPNHALAHRGMGMVLGRTKRGSRAIEEFERALALDPNLAKAHASLGVALAFVGRAEETEAHVLEALRLSPRDATSYVWFLHIGGAKAYLAEYEAAVAWLRKSIDANELRERSSVRPSANFCLGSI